MKNRFSVSAFLISAFAIIAYAGRSAAQTGTQNVLVTNTTSQAVPIKPVASTFPVSVLNVPTTRSYVMNTPAAPAFTAHSEDKNLYRAFLPLEIADGYASANSNIVIPSGKRLIVDFVSGFSNGTNPAYQMELYATLAGAVKNDLVLPLDPLPAIAENTSAFGYVHFSVDAGETLTVYLYRANAVGAVSGYVAITGHWVSLP